MFQRLFHYFVGRRHFWRHASFGEVAELYISRMLRIVGINVAAGFASIYLYQLGYSLLTLTSLWIAYFIMKAVIAYVAARYVAFFGPKHGILLSNFIYIPAMVALSFAEQLGGVAIAVWLISLAISTTMYQISYTVDFSKVKSLNHAGKELGFMNIFERLAAALSPVVGGIIALFFGPQTIMWVGALVFLLSAMPLFFTGEQTHTRRKLSFAGFPFRANMWNFVSRSGVGFDLATTTFVWSMFIVVTIFPGFGDEIYVTLGALSAVTVMAAIITSYVYGRIIDRRRGGQLLRVSVLVNALVHASRPFVTTPPLAVVTNVANEIGSAGYGLPQMRGMFDAADNSGHRVVYMLFAELFADLGGLLAVSVLHLMVWRFGEANALHDFFFVAAIAVLAIGFARYRIYTK